MPDPNVIRQALRVRLQENARFIREKAKRYPEQSNAEVASKLEALAAQLEDRRLGALALLLETLEKALQPKKGARRMPD
jgi:DNA-binding transcriptional MerR regulator